MKRPIQQKTKIKKVKQGFQFVIFLFSIILYGSSLFAQTVSVNSPANCFAATFDFTLDTNNSPDATGRNVYYYSNSSLEIRYNNGVSRWEIKARGGNNDVYYVNSFASSPNPPDSNTSAWDDFGFCDNTGAPTVSGDGTQSSIGGDPCASLGGDTDGDGACDDNDICPGFDDFADQDFDGIPDGCDANPTVPDGVMVTAICLDPNPILFTLSGTDGTGRNIYSTTFANGLEVRYSTTNGRWELRASGGAMDVYLYNTFASFPDPPSSSGTWQGTSILNCNTAPTPAVNGSGTQTDLGCTIAIGTPSITQPTCGSDGVVSVSASGARGAITYILKQGGSELTSNSTGTFTGLDAGTFKVVASDGTFPSGQCEAETGDIVLILQDTQAPIAVCKDAIVKLSGGGVLTPQQIDNGSSDNCAITNLSLSRTTFDCNDAQYLPTRVWINEIHYDNTGADTGEFIEVAGTAGTNLTGYSLVLYNGADGLVYDTINLSGVIDNEENGLGALSFAYVGIQNGAPDGIVLANGTTVIQFLSYEGSFQAADGVANGMTSTDIVVSETASTAVGSSLRLRGTGNRYSNFTWGSPVPNSAGSKNANQTFTVVPKGLIDVTLTVTDDAGNSASCNATVKVVDDVAPTASNPAPTNVSCPSEVPAVNPDVVIDEADNCGTPTVTLFDQANNGGSGNQASPLIIKRKYRVTDASGNFKDVVHTITVIDNEAPIINCPNGFATGNDPGVCQDFVAFNVTANDNCGGYTISNDVNGQTSTNGVLNFTQTYPVGGPYTVNFTATDTAGNTATCSSTFSVLDIEPPTIACPSNIVESNDPGQCGAVVNYTPPVGVDNCPGAATTLIGGLGSGAFFPVGTTTETYRVTDGRGNTKECSFTITVNDIEPPVVSVKDITVSLDANGNFAITSANYVFDNIVTAITDNCGVNMVVNTSKTSFNCDDLGLNIVTFFFFDVNSNQIPVKVGITVEDPLSACCQAPIIVCPNDVTIECDESDAPSNTGTPTFTEGCGDVSISFSDLEIPSCGNLMSIQRTWTATDENNDTSTCVQTINVVDTSPPNIAVASATVECTEPTIPLAYRLTVNSATGAGDYLTGIGTFAAQLNSVPLTADLQLADDGVAPTSDGCSALADLTGKIALIDRGNCFFADKVQNAKDAGALAVIIANNNTLFPDQVLNVAGPYEVQLPMIFVSYNTGVILKNAMLSETVNVSLYDNDITVSDNCDARPIVMIAAVGLVPGSCPNLSDVVYTYSVTDACGNQSTTERFISVVDNTPPSLNVVAENTVECSDPTIPLANRLTVNSAIGAGDYLTGIGTFAAQLNTVPLTADLQLADDGLAPTSDGCSALADLTGKIALIDRGNCFFADKVQNAKDAGALAVIIANNNTLFPDQVLNVAGPYEVQLPMVFVSYNTGLALKNAMLSETVNVSLYDNDITVNDNCDVMPIVMISDLQSIPGTCDNEGDLIYTYTATDACGNASSVIRTIHIIDTTPPVIVCPDQEPYTRSSDTGLCTYKIIGNEFDATATDNCTVEPALSWVVSNPNATTQNGIDTLADVELQSGMNTITWTADDGCGNTASCSFIVNVDKITTITTVTATPSTQQYSDRVTFDVTVTPGDCSGAGQAASFALIYVGNQLMGKAILTVDGFGNLEGSLTAALLENPNFNGEMSPGLKEVKAVFMGINPNYTVNDATTSLTITQENALVDYTGQSLQATPSSSSSLATVVLSANIQDIADGYRGDIRNATVTFIDVDHGNAIIAGPIQVSTLVNPGDPTLGTVSVPWNVNIGAAAAESYTVGIKVDAYYTVYDETVITVYKPVGDFITGGGYIMPFNSAGTYASTDGLRTNFGFNVGYNKKGNKLKGNMNVIFRIEQNDGVHRYQIKGNAMQALGVNVADPTAKTAEFITKSNLTDITDPNNPISLGGNFILKVELTDRGEPGFDDSISFNLTDGGTLIYSSNWVGISTAELQLASGNLLVHSGYSVGRTNETASSAVAASSTFELQTWPNPSKDEFYLKLNSSNRIDKMEIFVYDVNGRQVYHDLGNANEEYHFGKAFQSGMYFVKVLQADKSDQVRMIKY